MVLGDSLLATTCLAEREEAVCGQRPDLSYGRRGAYRLDESLVLPGETMQSGPFVMEAVAVERPQDHLLLATAVYGDTVRALQLAWADGAGGRGSRGTVPDVPGSRCWR